ncbi:PQQ-binding-like beta-propeller repeat protein [Sulfitobacter aestuarii]|uniref:PQQ-binding-like beta-propeller repeat protein n=1 Tax=Sulfitobacter aestuarii TaxID=2161676 RepID=A0ABW5U0N9_9RHOB
MLLGACSEPQTYLPGKREHVRSVLQDPGMTVEQDRSDLPNRSRAISLPRTAANASWTHAIGSPASRVSHAALAADPQPLWSAPIGAGDSRKLRITADPVVGGGRIFTLDAGAQVTATSSSGETLWTRDLTPASDPRGQATGGGLALAGDTLYVSVGYGILAALDVASGAPRWQQKLEASGSGTPTVSGDLVYLTAGDDTGWAVRRSDGRVQWQTSSTRSVNNVLGMPAPALTDDLAIFGFGSGEVQAVFRRGGIPRWNTSVVGRRPGRALSSVSDLTGAPVVSGNVAYIGNHSGRIAALDIGSGEQLWSVPEGAIGPVWPVGDSIFAISDLNELIRLDARDGARIWGVKLPNFVSDKPKRQSEVVAHYGPVLAGGRIIIASNDGQLRSYDPRDGRLIGTTPVPGGATTAPVVAGGTLYVVSTEGKLHAFR